MHESPVLKVLPNGIRVVLDPIANFRSAAIGVWINAGAVDEAQDENGAAHCLEHMAFKGTQRRSARDIVEEIENRGGSINAETGYQRTAYYVRVLEDDVRCSLDVLSDIIFNSNFDPQDLALEKDVIIQEIKDAADTPEDVAFESAQRLAWSGHSLGRPIIGSEQSVSRFTETSLRNFHSSFYHPENIVIGISGGFDSDRILEAVRYAFASNEFGEFKPKERVTPTFHEGKKFHERDFEQSQIVIQFRGPSIKSCDLYSFKALTEILGGGMASRLFQKIREEMGIAYSIYSYLDIYDDVGVLGIYAGVDGANQQAVLDAVFDEINSIIRNVSQHELDRAKAVMRATLIMSYETPSVRLDAAIARLFGTGKIADLVEFERLIDSVTIDSVKLCASEMMRGGSAVVSIGRTPPVSMN